MFIFVRTKKEKVMLTLKEWKIVMRYAIFIFVASMYLNASYNYFWLEELPNSYEVMITILGAIIVARKEKSK